MKGHPRFTDAFFQKAITDISVNNTLSFTFNQFHYFIDRRLKRKTVVPFSTSIFAYGIFFFGFYTCIVFALAAFSIEIAGIKRL